MQEFGDWDNMDDVNMQTENPRRYKALLQVARHSSAWQLSLSRASSHELQAKDAYNKFYFRYPNGESRADVVQRATLFTSKLFRCRAPFEQLGRTSSTSTPTGAIASTTSCFCTA